MYPKPFSPEKRNYLIRKPFEEFKQLFQEISRSEQNRLAPLLPKHQGFRPESDELKRVQLQHLWGDANNPESARYNLAWDILGKIWASWIVSQPLLNKLLENFHNSDDFQDGEPKPPNTPLDIECFKYLAVASLKGSISQETIQKFYEFGYFQQDKIIESYISLARNEEEIKKNNDLLIQIKAIQDIRRDLQTLTQKNDSFLNQSFFQTELEQLLNFQNKEEEKVRFLDTEITKIATIVSRLPSLEKYLDDLKYDMEVSKRENIDQQNIIETIIEKTEKYTKDIELLNAMANDNSRHLDELRISLHSLSIAQPLPLSLTDMVSSGLNDLENFAPTTQPIHGCNEFLQHRLLPALADWLPGITLRWAELFHHAVWACRWVLVPNPAWALAYQEAMGGTAQLHIVQVEPTWLCFADAWQGGVAQWWMAARQRPDCLHLLLFEDINRALPECWARPWLDLLAGFRNVLPADGQPEWPANLRVLACMASDKAALPLSKAVVQNWAAVCLQPVGHRADLQTELHEGHIPWAAWQSWGTQEKTERASQRPWEESHEVEIDWSQFGPLARSVARDLCRLQASMQHLDPQTDAMQTIKNIRLTWPQEYLSPQDDADE